MCSSDLSSRTTQNTLIRDPGIPLSQVQPRGSESEDRDEQDTIISHKWCEENDDVNVKEGNRYPCIVHEVYFLLRTKQLKKYEMPPCDFFFRPVWTHSAIETPCSTATTGSNMNEQRRRSYRECQIKL